MLSARLLFFISIMALTIIFTPDAQAERILWQQVADVQAQEIETEYNRKLLGIEENYRQRLRELKSRRSYNNSDSEEARRNRMLEAREQAERLNRERTEKRQELERRLLRKKEEAYRNDWRQRNRQTQTIGESRNKLQIRERTVRAK